MGGRKPEGKPKLGRPPEGLNRGGEPLRIRDYERTLFTMRPSTRERLKRAAKRESRAEWKIVDQALIEYFDRAK